MVSKSASEKAPLTQPRCPTASANDGKGRAPTQSSNASASGSRFSRPTW